MRAGPVRIAALAALLATLVVSAEGCASRRVRRAASVEMAAGETLYRRAIDQLARRKLAQAKTLLERVQFTAENRPKLEPLVWLALADVTFYDGDDLALIDARSKYVDFVTRYADHAKAPYAQFQAGVCSLKMMSGPGRDQSQSHTAVNDLLEVERRFPKSPYADAARGMVDLAESSLVEHEYLVGRFYLKRKAYASASERFRGILERYPRARQSQKEKVYFQLGRALILGNSKEEGRIYLDKLVADYPDGAYALQARRFLAGLVTREKGTGKS